MVSSYEWDEESINSQIMNMIVKFASAFLKDVQRLYPCDFCRVLRFYILSGVFIMILFMCAHLCTPFKYGAHFYWKCLFGWYIAVTQCANFKGRIQYVKYPCWLAHTLWAKYLIALGFQSPKTQFYDQTQGECLRILLVGRYKSLEYSVWRSTSKRGWWAYGSNSLKDM